MGMFNLPLKHDGRPTVKGLNLKPLGDACTRWKWGKWMQQRQGSQSHINDVDTRTPPYVTEVVGGVEHRSKASRSTRGIFPSSLTSPL